MSDVFTTSKARVEGKRPVGYNRFLSALREINAPRALLVNPAYSNPKLHTSAATYPALRSRLLSLYKLH